MTKNSNINNLNIDNENELKEKNLDLESEFNSNNDIENLENNKHELNLNNETIETSNDFDNKIENLEFDKQQKINQNNEKINVISNSEEIIFNLYKNKVSNLLKTLNYFKKTIDVEYENPEINVFIKGFKMLLNEINNNLIEMEIKEVLIKNGDLFDEKTMEVFEVIESNSYKNLEIIDVIYPGYIFKDKVIMHAKVKVNLNDERKK